MTELRSVPVTYPANLRLRADKVRVHVDLEQPAEDEGCKSCDRPTFLEGRKAFRDRQRSQFLECREKPYAVAERTLVGRVAEEVPCVPEAVAFGKLGVDFASMKMSKLCGFDRNPWSQGVRPKAHRDKTGFTVPGDHKEVRLMRFSSADENDC